MNNEINILDYGAGNILSISRAFEYCGATTNIITNNEDLKNVKNLVIPGVGSFPNAMKLIKSKNFFSTLIDLNKIKTPIMGICLGMQILFDFGEEFGINKGLGFIEGSVVKIPIEFNGSTRKIPNIGWDKLDFSETKLNFIEKKLIPNVYFVHSYMAIPSHKKDIFASINYDGLDVVAAVEKDNLFGCQFHPEKSGNVGLCFLKYFINKTKNL
jgi:imidazole glycerol-phosphate synthase subunit HisH